MKNLIRIVLVTFTVLSCKPETNKTENHKHENHNMESESKDEPKKKSLSPHTSTMAMIGDAHIHIDYSSPGVRDRIIFGGLLAFDQVWQSGAHMATWVESNKDLEIGDNILPAGKYGFFTIPSKDEWTVIFNSKWDQHGKDEYDEKNDILRFKVKPKVLENSMEHLEYKVNKIDYQNGSILLAWEKMSIQFNFKVK